MTELQRVALDRTPTRTVVRYQQVFSGLPVENRQLTVTVRSDGAVVGWEANLAALSGPVTPRVISADQAIRIAFKVAASARAGAPKKVNPKEVVLAIDGRAVRTWRVPVAALPRGIFDVYVRSDDASVVWVRNRMLR